MKTIAVIGGSYGIGNAIVKNLSPENEIVSFSRTINSEVPNVKYVKLDILEDELPELETLHGLVYCPGSINLKPFKRLSLEAFKTDFEINVLGAVKAIQHFSKALVNGKGSVVLFSTVATQLGMPFHASVAASKSAVEGLTKSLAAEYAGAIRFNAIAPTVTDTPLAQKLLRNEKQRELMSERHPLKHFLQPEKVAKLASYLLSDDSEAISGQIFTIDSGLVSMKL